MLGIVAVVLVGGCAMETGEGSLAPNEEHPAEAEQAFDASIFKFVAVVPDDGHDPSGGSQLAAASLGFADGRQGILPQTWTCFIRVWLPIRLNYILISPSTAANMTAPVADAAGSAVMHSQPKWPLPVLFCKAFAARMEQIFKQVPGGPTGAKVTSP